MKKILYMIFLCDSWHSVESMRLCGITSGKTKMLNTLDKLSKNGIIDIIDIIHPDDCISKINDKTKFVHVATVYAGDCRTDGGHII